MPWLVVLGHGSWRAGGHRFEAGKHEVSDEIAQLALRSPVKSLVVMAEEPLIEAPEGAPLTPEHIKRGRRGVQIQADAAEPEETPLDPLEDVSREFDCPYCPLGFASQAAADRHVDRAHGVELKTNVPVEEPKPKPTPAEVRAALGPFEPEGEDHPAEADPPPEPVAG